jgi:multidrug resistance efflux pump
MGRKPWIPLTFLAMIAALLITWAGIHSRLRRGVLYDTRPKPVFKDDRGFVLTGTLSLVVTTQIDARNLELAVPLNSWVLKGQLIAEADSGVAPEQINRALLCREEANAAVAEAQANIREIDAELATTRADARNIESELISSETAELEGRLEFERRDRLFRNEVASQLDHDEAVFTRDSAASAAAEVRSHLGATLVKISELETRSRNARSSLSEAMMRSSATEAGVEQMEQTGRTPVISPADGFIVASDLFPGTFGIASDPDLLCVHTHVHQADVASVRFGQQAVVAIYGEPATTLRAKVSAISETPINSPDAASYVVTLSVENPEAKRFAGASVEIRLQTMPK